MIDYNKFIDVVGKIINSKQPKPPMGTGDNVTLDVNLLNRYCTRIKNPSAGMEDLKAAAYICNTKELVQYPCKNTSGVVDLNMVLILPAGKKLYENIQNQLRNKLTWKKIKTWIESDKWLFKLLTLCITVLTLLINIV